MNIAKSNRIIMKFIGAKAISEDSLNPLILKWDCPKFPLAHNKFLSQNELKFHSDWNWLMEVVEKIESLGYDVFVNTCVCRITDVGQDILEDIEAFVHKNKRKAVYNACIEFIKWYNQLQPK